MKSKLLSILLIFTLVAGSMFCFPVTAAASMSVKDVQLTLMNGHRGDLIFENTASWQLSLTNPGYQDETITVNAAAKDQTGRQIWSENRTILLSQRSKKVQGFQIPISVYGIYSMTATVSGSFGTVTRSGSFSHVVDHQASNDFMGVQNHFAWQNWETPIDSLPLIRETGFGLVRDHIEWPAVDVNVANGEGIPAHVRETVEKIHQSGRKLILTIGNSNTEVDNGGMPVSSSGLRALSEYCTYVATAFKGKVYAYEFWNEPNYISAFCNGIDHTGAEYKEALRTAYNAIKAVDQNVIVLGGSLTAMEYKWDGSQGDSMNYMDEILAADAADYMDGFSFHPYANSGEYFDENTKVVTPNVEEQLKIVRQKLNDVGKTTLPIWITEAGTTSFTDDNTDGNDWDQGYTEEEQAINLARLIPIVKAEPTVKALSIYNFREKGNDANNKEHNFGLVDSFYDGKPAIATLSFLNDFLLDAGTAAKTTDGSLTQYRMKDKYDNSEYFAFWSTGGANNTLKVSGNRNTEVLFEENFNGKSETEKVIVRYPTSNNAKVENGVLAFSGKPVQGASLNMESVESGQITWSMKVTPNNNFFRFTATQKDAATWESNTFSNVSIGDDSKLNVTGGSSYNGVPGTSYILNILYDMDQQKAKAQWVSMDGTVLTEGETAYTNGSVANLSWVGNWTTEGAVSQFDDITVRRGNHLVQAGAVALSDKTVTCPNSHKIEVYDLYGNPIAENSITVGASPVFVKCTPVNNKPAIKISGNLVTVSGTMNPEIESATVVAYKCGFTGEKTLVYAEQFTAENSYGYTTEFTLDWGKDLYTVAVFDGARSTASLNSGDFGFTLEYYCNGKQVYGLRDLKNGDIVTARLVASNPNGSDKNLTLYGVVYAEDDVMLEVGNGTIDWNGAKEKECNVSFTIENVGKVEGIKFLIWDNQLRPIVNAIQ